MNRTLWPLAVLAVIAVIVAACGNAPARTVAGTAGGGVLTTTTASTTTHEKAVKFSKCMRANGVGAFPDPSPSGQLTIDGVVNGSSLDPNSPVFKQAISACKGLEPAGFTGGKVTPAQTTARLKFAQCVRDNGVPDFPDPTPNGPLVDTNRIPSAATTGGMSALNAAMQKCGQYASAAGVQGNR